jgi:hypothetical protein
LTWSVIVILAGAENFSPCLRAADDLAIGFKCNGADGNGPPMGIRLRPLPRQRNDGPGVPQYLPRYPPPGRWCIVFFRAACGIGRRSGAINGSERACGGRSIAIIEFWFRRGFCVGGLWPGS